MFFNLPPFDEDSIGFVFTASIYDYVTGSNIKKKSEEDNQKLFLLSKICQKDFFENMPKTFTISTKNSTLHFNIQMLKETSPVISKFVQDNPNENNYSLNLTDDDNILVKFAQLYQGKSIIFEEGDIPLIQRFTQLLQIKNCPNFLKPKSLATTQIDSDGKRVYKSISFLGSSSFSETIEIYKNGLISYLTREEFNYFTIITKKKEYKCCIFGVYTSSVIRQILDEDSSQKEFKYNFEDNKEEFQLICDFFNCQKIDITNENMDSLKEIAEDLQINCILQSIDNYINHYEKVTEKIEKYEGIIDKIDELFDMLYNIRTHGIEKVKNRIIESGWFREERRVEELSAFIISVVKVNFSLQKDICELLIKLKEEENDDNKFQLLIPFTIERLMTLYWPHNYLINYEDGKDEEKRRFSIHNNRNTEETINLTNRCVYSFIRILYKRGLISKEELFESLKNYDFSSNALNAFFLPELFEINPKNIEIIEKNSKNKIRQFVSNVNGPKISLKDISTNEASSRGMYYFWPKFALKYLPDKIGLYEEMLDKMEPDDELTKSIWYDDVDSFQRIISRDGIDIKKCRILYNIFDDFEEKMNLINYSALYGSIKCFKFIILNEGEIDESTFYFSICGGNNEIIKIVDQQRSKPFISDKKEKIRYQNLMIDRSFVSFWFNFENPGVPYVDGILFKPHPESKEYDKFDGDNIQYQRISDDVYIFLNCCNINNIIAPTIAMNKNDLFDWIFENNFVNNGKSGNDLKHIAVLSASSGNAHSLIALFDNGYFVNKKIISIAARNGFYTLTKLLLDLYDKKAASDSKSHDFNDSFDSFDFKSIVHFGNISIFKLFIGKMNNASLEKALLHAIEINCKKIVQYVFDHLDRFDFKIDNNDFITSALKLSIKTHKMFNFLFDYFKKLKPELFNVDLFSTLLIHACTNSNLEVTKEVTEMILKEDDKYDFTTAFFKASSSKSMKICQYFIDNKVLIEFENNPYIGSLGGISFELFENIIKSIDPKIKFLFYECVHEAILNKNKKLIEIIFEEKPPKGNELFEGVQTEDIEIVDLILKYNSEPSFVNKVTVDGTCLCLAVNLRNKEIVERLLCVPGIDLNLYDSRRNQTPLAIAVEYRDLELVDIILNYIDNSSDSLAISSTLGYLQDDFCKANKQVSEDEWNIIERFFKAKSVDPNIFQFHEFGSSTIPFLSIACFDNKIDIVELLLSLDNINVNIYDPSSYFTPLMFALDCSNIEIAKLLIKHPKTNINLRDQNDESALTIAVRNKQKEIIDLLVKDERFDPFESKLSCAFIYSCNEIAQQLSSLSFLDVNEYYLIPGEARKINALEHSVEINDDAKIDMIINHHSFDIYKSQVNRSIFIAAKNNNINVFQKLMKLIDNDINIHQDTKENLLTYASRNLSGDIVDLIIINNNNYQVLDAFVNTYSHFDMIRNQNQNQNQRQHQPHRFGNILIRGRNRFQIQNDPIWKTNQNVMDAQLIGDKITLIEMIEKIYNYDNEHDHIINFDKFFQNGRSFFTVIVNDFPEISEVCDFLIEHGADPNKADKNGNYPLEHAIRINSLGMATSLLNSNKFNLNQTKNGFSYLHLAAQNKDPAILSLLIENAGIDINSVDERGETPLMHACRSCSIECINCLFRKDNLDYLHRNKKGKDALDIFIPLPSDKKESIKKDRTKFHDTLCSILKKSF
ncbi:hypothetical protein M9Y10_023027 [Tritrichomonas musculus]|uniref:DUF3447 domain-containing protein n=1 Tax=Tritrichomonas musculus TaxID=1915356 RepID=A0ABR2KUY7_9EUKA